MTTSSTRLIPPVLVLLLAGACGSTVPAAEQQGPGALGTGGLSSGLPARSSQSSGAAAQAVGTPEQPRLSAGRTASGAPVLNPSSLPSGTLGPVQDGPGVTARTLTIGLSYTKNADAEQSALGNSAVTTGDPGAIMHILLDDLNAHGGIAGRRLVPVDYAVDALQSQSKTQSQMEQEQCAAFTQDKHVFAALPAGGDSVLACLHRAGAIGVSGGNIIGETTSTFDRYPEDFDSTAMSIDRLARDLPPVLQQQGYFSPWNTTTGSAGGPPARVGIIVPDRPYFRAGTTALLAALRAVGVVVQPQDVAYYYWPKSASENAQAVTDIQGYVLKFRSSGVTHVIPLEQNGLVFFAAAADKQRYHPRYGLNSGTAAQEYNGSLVPASQLSGAVGLGYFPSVDLQSSDNPDDGPYSSPARRRCLALLKAHGQSFSSTNAQAIGLLLCDMFWNLKRVVESVPAGQGLNQRTVSAALDRIGTLPSASLVSVVYGPHHRDAVSAGWAWRFEDGCSCMRYSGPRLVLP